MARVRPSERATKRGEMKSDLKKEIVTHLTQDMQEAREGTARDKSLVSKVKRGT